jgi:serine/threonine protein kinase
MTDLPDEGAAASSDRDLTQATPATPKVSVSIGPYRLLERIGEGGMGEVWLAEQARPVHRHVALKVIKAGMDTAQVVGRFDAERQALALMDHPAIARVFDGGATSGPSVLRHGVRAG